MKKIIYMIAALFAVSACSIERLPHGSLDKGTIIDDPSASLNSLMNGCYSQLKGWSDVMHRCGEYAGDNMMIRGTSTDAFYEFISFSRTPNNYRLQSFWDSSYKVIAQTSNILDMFDEGDDPDVDNNLGECYFLRGTMYFYLCRAYGRPYAQNPETNLGVPIVNGTPDDIINLELPDRATVKETYAQAVNDLKKAEELLTKNRGPAYASKEAAQAVLSRVYLFMSGTFDSPNNEYAQQAVDYATKVIDSGRFDLLDRQSFMNYNRTVPESNKESIFVVKRLASEFKGFDHYYGVGGMYGVIGGMGWGEMYASAKYIDLLNETGRNDWRPESRRMVDARASFIDPQYSEENELTFRFVKDLYPNRPNLTANDQTNFTYIQAKLVKKEGAWVAVEQGVTQFSSSVDANGALVPLRDSEGKIVTKDIEYPLVAVSEGEEVYKIEKYNTTNNISPIYIDVEGVIDYRMKLNRVYPMFYISKCSREGEESHLHSPVISRLGEIYLNRAEANAKLGKYGEALTDLNTIRERSIPGAGYSMLDSSNAEELISKERQLELAYQAERSYDVFRNGRDLERAYPGPHDALKNVSATDYRVIYFIPQNAINSYPGVLTQNPTSN